MIWAAPLPSNTGARHQGSLGVYVARRVRRFPVTLGILAAIASVWSFSAVDLDQCADQASTPNYAAFTYGTRRLQMGGIACWRTDPFTNVERILTGREPQMLPTPLIALPAATNPWPALWAGLELGLFALLARLCVQSRAAIRARLVAAAQWWPLPLVWILAVPFVTVPAIGSHVPFVITSSHPPVVETVSWLGRTTTSCALTPTLPHDPAVLYSCPTSRPILSTFYPGLLFFLAGVWLLSTRRRTRQAARLALWLGLIQIGVPILIERHALVLDCRLGPCWPVEDFPTFDLTLGALLWLFSLGGVAAFLNRPSELPPAPILARGATAGWVFGRQDRREEDSMSSITGHVVD